jgi:hypothetical protein
MRSMALWSGAVISRPLTRLAADGKLVAFSYFLRGPLGVYSLKISQDVGSTHLLEVSR